jgi:hypothetical protein
MTDTRALVERLRAEVEYLDDRPGEIAYGRVFSEAADRIEALDARAEAAEAQVAKLEEALKPFADLADDYLADTINFDEDTIMAGRITHRGEEATPPRVTFADFIAARLALRDTP